MAENYNNIIKSQIGRVKASVRASRYFPVVGDTVRIDAETKWGQSSEWQTNDGSGNPVTVVGNLILQKDSKEITMIAAGELRQKFVVRNYLTETIVNKMIYVMLPQVLPYFDVTATEIARVGDTGYINIIAENGYHTSRRNTIIARIYRENELEPIKSIGFDTSRPGPTIWASSSFSFEKNTDRGIYDVEIDVTDTLTGITLTKRINKLVTITPKLCPKPADTSTGYEVVSTYRAVTSYAGTKTFDVRLWRNINDSGMNYAEVILPKGDAVAKYDFIPLQNLPAGTTLCLKLDPQEPEAYPFRMLVQGGIDSNKGNENGTPNFTRESPLLITHDNTEVWNWRWRSFGSMQFANNCRNIVLDGMGYHDTGIYFTPFDDSMQINSCIFLGGGLSYFEMFGCDIDGTGFAGISAKTDPNVNAPWYWRGNFEMYLNIHHCTIRNTYGEGVYIGYFGTGEIVNGSVKYYAHLLRDLRLYRCKFYHCGFDPVQITNAVGVEVCYLDIEKCCYKKEANQANTFSCGMDGKLYNCKVWDNYSSLGIIFPLVSTLEIFNNILTCDKDTLGFSWTHWTGGDPATDETLGYKIYNNIIKARVIAGVNGNISYKNFTMNDNVFITSEGDTSLPANFTGDGNIFIKASEEYDEIDNYLKVADSANYDYQPNYNSILVSAGKSALTDYDMRGYKRWYNNVRHCGPLMGIYKNPDIPDTEIVLNNISLTFSGNLTVDVVFNHSTNFVPVKYKLKETSDLSDTDWQTYSDHITYVFGSVGNKTLYGQLQDVNGNVSETRSATVTVLEDMHKAVISFGWVKELLNGQAQRFDEVNKLTRQVYAMNPTFYWQDGTVAGSLSRNDTITSYWMSENTKGATTGDDSGIYPDEILQRNVVVTSNSSSYRDCSINIAPGRYKIRFFCSSIVAADPVGKIRLRIIADDQDINVPIPDGFTTKNNLTEWLEQEVTVPEPGTIRLLWGIETPSGYYTCPLNIIEIEEI